MSSRPLFDARANVQLLARCILLLRVSINLAQQAHAAGTTRRLRRALRTARGGATRRCNRRTARTHGASHRSATRATRPDPTVRANDGESSR